MGNAGDKTSDLDINCRVRRVLVRHWIDLGQISVRTTCGVVWLAGSLERLPHSGAELDAPDVQGVLMEIKRTSDVRRIQVSFENWAEQSGAWTAAAGHRTR
jgi:hypothetical protein